MGTTTSRSTFRLEYRVSTNIRATAAAVWGLLTNVGDYPRWNTTVTSSEGMIKDGAKLRLKVAVAPKRLFNLTVSKVVPNRSMVWSDGFAPMFRGVRTFTLTPKDDASVDFEMVEVFGGLMLPMIAGSLPDFEPVFARYAEDLKKEAEERFALRRCLRCDRWLSLDLRPERRLIPFVNQCVSLLEPKVVPPQNALRRPP